MECVYIFSCVAWSYFKRVSNRCHDTIFDSDENESDMENASLQQRLMEAQPRGRPSIIRRGKMATNGR